MDSSTFIAEFAQIANAPNGVQRLREMILDLAVRGKLVPQDPNDEPAEKLLEKLFRDNKKCEPVTIESQLWSIPSQWTWCRLGNIIDFTMGKTPPRKNSIYWADNTTDGHYWVSISDMPNKGRINTTKEYISTVAKNEKFKKEPSPIGTLIMSFKLSIGKVAILDIPAFHNEAIISILTSSKELKMYLFQSLPLLSNLGNKNSAIKGSTLNSTSISNLLIPLPPLAEQKRIVAKVNELMALCDRLEQSQQARENTRSALCTSALHQLMNAESDTDLQSAWSMVSTHFTTLANHPSAVKGLRETILQLAVRGKLVPQDTNDEPAEKLLETLREERSLYYLNNQENKECLTMAKKIKKLPASNSPYSLPTNWQVTQLIDLCMFLVDCHNKTAPYSAEGIPIIRTTNVRNGKLNKKELKYVNQKTYLFWSRRCLPKPGDIIFTREAPMGEAAIIPKGLSICLGQRTMLIRPWYNVDARYLLICLLEPGLLDRGKNTAVGSTVKHFRVGDVERFNIMLPPLAEQKRIVAKVDELMALCDRLETQLTQRQQTATLLAQSATKSVVEDLSMLEGRSKEEEPILPMVEHKADDGGQLQLF